MKFISLFTRLGLLALGFILVAAVNAEGVWDNPSDDQPTQQALPMPCSTIGALRFSCSVF